MSAHRLPNGAVIAWFRQDLRIRDQAALAAAAESGRSVLPLYVLDDFTPGAWRMGAPAGGGCMVVSPRSAPISPASVRR